MTDSNIKSINCTQCAAPLSLHGGHRVESITCGYCGSVLDTKDEYKIVKQFKDARRPTMPLQLGMAGKIKGVEFTIIGVIEYQSSPDYAVWLEYMIFSPTHGYAWLVYDMGHFVFARRVRDLPDGEINQVYKSGFEARGHKFKVYDYGKTTINFVEGELTWIAEKGDKVKFIEGVSPPYSYSVETTANEKEYTLGEYLNYQEVYDSFGVKEGYMEPYGVHGAQPYVASKLTSSVYSVSKLFLPVAFLIWLVILVLGGGTQVFKDSISPAEYLTSQTGAVRTFNITDTGNLVELKLHSNLANAWGWYDIEIRNSSGPLFSMAKQISYYSGFDGGESWSEGTRRATALFKLPTEGEYSLHVIGEGGQGEYATTPQKVALDIEINEGVIVSRYFFYLTIIFLLAFLKQFIARKIFEGRRWGIDDDE